MRLHPLLAALMISPLVLLAADTKAPPAPEYRSPYSVQFDWPIEKLIPDILSTPRGDAKKQSRIPYEQWYSADTKRRFGSWGVPRLHQPVPAGIDAMPAEFKRQRVIAIGMRYIGYSYQHHYLPDFDPPADWPWNEVRSGKNGKGTDCSNYVSHVYNLALGIMPNSAIGPQSKLTEAPLADGKTVKLQRIERPEKYEDFPTQLRTGDLLFIKNTAGNVSHVVLWVGSIGRSPENVPLVLDSTGEGRHDANGQAIPDGVHLRPFTRTSWYHRSASHALRVIP